MLQPIAELSELAEGEGVRVEAGVEEGDLDGALGDRWGWRIELVEPRFGDRALALLVDVEPVRCPGRPAVEADPEPYWSVAFGRSHDDVHVPGVEAVGDRSLRRVEHDGLPLHRPVPGERPLVEPQLRRRL